MRMSFSTMSKKIIGAVIICSILFCSCAKKQYCISYKGYPYNGLWKKSKPGRGNQDKKVIGR